MKLIFFLLSIMAVTGQEKVGNCLLGQRGRWIIPRIFNTGFAGMPLFFIFPDATTLLVECRRMSRNPSQNFVRQKCATKNRKQFQNGPQWIVDYNTSIFLNKNHTVQLDYGLITHFQ